jgi:hypothetical protein
MNRIAQLLEGLTIQQQASAIQQQQQQQISNDKLQALALEQNVISQKLPNIVVGVDITPSQASESKSNSGFLDLMELLNLQLPSVSLRDADKFTIKESETKNFEWKWRYHDESDSYDYFRSYLETIGKCAVVVGNGQYCNDRKLFSQHVWSIRRQNLDGSRQPVIHVGKVSGCVDIAVLNVQSHNGTTITRNMIYYCFEIKKHEVLSSKLNSCIREACVQIIGLCGYNINNTPCVILTDLTKLHFVFYLSVTSDMPFLKYDIVVQPCSDIVSAISFSEERVKLRCLSFNFGRPPTPPTSVSDSGVSSDNDAYDNAEASEEVDSLR